MTLVEGNAVRRVGLNVFLLIELTLLLLLLLVLLKLLTPPDLRLRPKRRPRRFSSPRQPAANPNHLATLPYPARPQTPARAHAGKHAIRT